MKSPKAKLAELAVAGGKPLFAERILPGRPHLGNRTSLHRRLDQILDARWLSNAGPMVEELERRIAERVGVAHCVTVVNATIGLEIAARALNLTGEVIVPSLTFVATAHALRRIGLQPVFADVAPGTHNLDPARVAELVTPRTTAVLGVHLWGLPCDVESLERVAHQHELKLMFDAAHAFACTHRGRPIGGFGNLEVFSFHATKFFNSFEGGAIVTNDGALAERARRIRNFGFTDPDEATLLGTNGKMTEICAAMGLTSLELLETFVEVNREAYSAYRLALAGLAGIELLDYPADERNNYQYLVLEVDPKAGISRDLLTAALRAENVWARPYFRLGCHQMEPYRSERSGIRSPLPNSERLSGRLLTLPTGPSLAREDIPAVASVVRVAVENAGSLTRLLESAS